MHPASSVGRTAGVVAVMLYIAYLATAACICRIDAYALAVDSMRENQCAAQLLRTSSVRIRDQHPAGIGQSKWHWGVRRGRWWCWWEGDVLGTARWPLAL